MKKDSIEFKDFTFDADISPFISLQHCTGGYYGCDQEYDLEVKEVRELVAFLTEWLEEQDQGE